MLLLKSYLELRPHVLILYNRNYSKVKSQIFLSHDEPPFPICNR